MTKLQKNTQSCVHKKRPEKDIFPETEDFNFPLREGVYCSEDAPRFLQNMRQESMMMLARPFDLIKRLAAKYISAKALEKYWQMTEAGLML